MIIASMPSTLDIEKSSDANITFSLNNQTIETTTTEVNNITSSIQTSIDTSVSTNNNSINIMAEEGNTSLGVAATSNNYNSLTGKPSINGVTLIGDLSIAELGVIDDTQVSKITTFSSEKIQQQINNSSAAIQELVGTEEKPLIAANLEMGSYILSGIVQSSETNVETFNVSRRHYAINKEIDGLTILWDCNPYTQIQYYIAFYTDNTLSPFENTIELVTKEDLKWLSLDCGEF